ncbi:hypothetical protein J2S62_002237 [Enteractinococcus fodinae]|uniref:Uncharacterized protein n=1 Tax=Enteractinococcus fodinae TaxID=684663 RepID=A0ABU2B318_9MICC|nr:hypothetical protein [Enteractinococcus fodinae]
MAKTTAAEFKALDTVETDVGKAVILAHISKDYALLPS